MSHKAFLADAWRMFERDPQTWKNVGNKKEKTDDGNGKDRNGVTKVTQQTESPADTWGTTEEKNVLED